MSRTKSGSRRYPTIDLLSASGRVLLGSGNERSCQRLAVQLALDPGVRSLSFVGSLPLAGEDIDVRMLVAEHDDGCIAYDIVDERDDRDIDTEGLLLIALDQHGVTLRATDSLSISAQPFARNCERIWEYRVLDVNHRLRARIERALGRERLSVRELGRSAGSTSGARPFPSSRVATSIYGEAS